jgi:hypothetical protein
LLFVEFFVKCKVLLHLSLAHLVYIVIKHPAILVEESIVPNDFADLRSKYWVVCNSLKYLALFLARGDEDTIEA